MVYIEYMIKEHSLKILINSRNVTYFRERGYEIKNGDTVDVLVNDLNEFSKQKITAICNLCKSENVISYEKYILNKKRHGFYGCKKCSRSKAKITNLKLYGEEYYNKTQESKELITKRNNEKYGVKTTLLLPKVIQKIKETNLKKYNVEYPLASKLVQTKSKKTLLERYGVDHYSKTIQFQQIGYNRWVSEITKKLINYDINDYILNADRTVNIKCEDHYYNITSKNLYQRREIQNVKLCTICNPLQKPYSNSELELLDYISSIYNGIIIHGDKNILNGLELDIYLPSLRLAFEFNGVYWHSDLYKPYKYHQNKSLLCVERDVQLFHIWEDDWDSKKEIIKSMIAYKIGIICKKIYARKCEIVEITDNKLIRDFLDNNHLQGFVGSTIKLGLYYNNELVSLMTFGKFRKNLGNNHKVDSYELLRFCNKLHTNVVGGASKLFNYFMDKYHPSEIISYASLDYSNGGIYRVLGFNLGHITVPNYFYIDQDMKRHNRFNFRKDVLVSRGEDIELTEKQIMDNKGFIRIYNSGNYMFRLVN